jgi:hypothetical protein
VRVPRTTISVWAATDEIGIHALQTTNGRDLAILIENDFECPTPTPGESQNDAFSRDDLHVGEGALACASRSNR